MASRSRSEAADKAGRRDAGCVGAGYQPWRTPGSLPILGVCPHVTGLIEHGWPLKPPPALDAAALSLGQ